ncbi:N-acetylmuramoyl-L-alanine amidase [Methylocella sp.]|uniref:N-acetylmuramoyl-L-alanine amidase n=1 Tax=Methylocella sp. TaxID=1978226 RepID=UPI0035B13286
MASSFAAGFAALALAALTGLAQCGPARAQAAGAPVPAVDAAAPVASAAALEDDGERARLVMTLSAPVSPAAFVLADPDRVIVDAPGLQFSIEPDVGRPASRKGARAGRAKGAPSPQTSLPRPEGLIASFRFGRLDRARGRLVVDLGAPARIVRAASETDADGGAKLVLELARTERAKFLAAAQASRQAVVELQPPAPASPAPAANGRPVVMIDPGHGGIDHGASVNGLVEKDIVLDFAQALAERLRTDGRFEPVLTRSDDTFVALDERVRLARERGAALFVSIHADTLAEAAGVAGATVYTAAERASDAAAAKLAEKENQADALAGVERPEAGAADVSDILNELTRRETRVYGHLFARTLLNYWKVSSRLNKNPLRSAGFRVLMAPDVPSILLELGYLSNEQDDAALQSPQWREAAIARVAEAVDAFFAERGAPERSAVGSLAAAPAGKDGAGEGRTGP